MEMGIGFKLNDDFIWIGSTNASIDDDTDVRNQRPVLLAELTEFQRSTHDGTINCKMKLAINHDDKSTGTAYNITVFLYIPNTVTFLSSTRHYYDVVKRAHHFEEDQTLRFELPRISFPHSSRIIFNVTMDTKTGLYLNSDNTGIAYELLSPLVSVLLGLDYDNTIFYGLSNNGQGYVFSSDLGTSWMSCSRTVYIVALYSDNFLNATLT
ncbi:uncharacterized protein LOC127736415 [Mytilus californianus]|uniref:uncharacterized protein LOC127736415 n=1 Tax=Mytilus californianus TaxID=6549 RepID=UPI0022481B88|nr:uncharacterized protein LOC127736415 [Mytilus californianus]